MRACALGANGFDDADARAPSRSTGVLPCACPRPAYPLQTAAPTIKFYLVLAYATLCRSGLPLGKMDFLGTLNLVDDL